MAATATQNAIATNLSKPLPDSSSDVPESVWPYGKRKLKGVLQANFAGMVGSGSIQNLGLIRIINYSLNDTPNKPEKFACGRLHLDLLFLHVKFHMRKLEALVHKAILELWRPDPCELTLLLSQTPDSILLQVLNLTELELNRVDIRVGLTRALYFMDGSPQAVRQLRKLVSQVESGDVAGIVSRTHHCINKELLFRFNNESIMSQRS